MPKRYQATSTNVDDYWQLFVNRRAYVLQSMRPHAESGRYYYFRPKAGKTTRRPVWRLRRSGDIWKVI